MSDQNETTGMSPPAVSYTPNPGPAHRRMHLVPEWDAAPDRWLPFHGRLEIGRYHPSREGEVGVLMIPEARVSRRHCILTQSPSGACTIRDVSRNGTWLDGRRLVPNLETAIAPGQALSVGTEHAFRLHGNVKNPRTWDRDRSTTLATRGLGLATVLVGDIRGYTRIVREAGAETLGQSVTRVFEALEETVLGHGGTVKEYPGDAMLAFWEQRSIHNPAAAACGAALALEARARELAADPAVWNLPDFPLEMDWALTTGPVIIRNFGGARPAGLSMVGEAVVLAFRLEKLADRITGPMLVCSLTKAMAQDRFALRELGEMQTQGFDEPVEVFALLGPR